MQEARDRRQDAGKAKAPRYELVKKSLHNCPNRAFAYRAVAALVDAEPGLELKITLAGIDGQRMAHAAHVYAERRGFRVSCRVRGAVLYIAKRLPKCCLEHRDRPATHLVENDPLCCGCYLKRLESRKWSVMHSVPSSDRKLARKAAAPASGESIGASAPMPWR